MDFRVAYSGVGELESWFGNVYFFFWTVHKRPCDGLCV